jgi:RNA polymerase sigma-70 factor (ECF subfamily)
MRSGARQAQSIRSTDPSGASRSDHELLVLARQGQTEAFGELHERYSRRLLITASKVVRNQEDCEDAVQDTFVKAFSHLDSFAGRSSFYTWLTSILINTCLMQLRRKRGYTFSSLDWQPETGVAWKDILPDLSIDLESEYLMKQRAHSLSRAISKLSPTLRSVLETYQQYECSMAEIAQRNSISSAAVKSRMLRARAQLRASYCLRKVL